MTDPSGDTVGSDLSAETAHLTNLSLTDSSTDVHQPSTPSADKSGAEEPRTVEGDVITAESANDGVQLQTSDNDGHTASGGGKSELLTTTAEDYHALPNEPPQRKESEAYQCRFCGLSYNYLTTLKAHERVHNVDQPYVCPKCGEAFRYNSELQYHMSSHKDQKVYKCSCGRSFYRYTDLLYHKHPGEDSDEESLDDADKARKVASQSSAGGFRLEHPLKMHNDLRTRPYVCQYCCKAYADSHQLSQHTASHRGERWYNPRASRYMMSRDTRQGMP